MGTSIDKSINQIIDNLMGKKAYLLNYSDRVALTDALNAMRKYQKIEQIIHNTDYIEEDVIRYKMICEVVEDGDNGKSNICKH